jgi:aldehyde:ferredoxin oxidoreductase
MSPRPADTPPGAGGGASSVCGWSGRLLWVDLGTGQHEVRPLSEEWAQTYVGARGFGVRLLYDLTGPETEPLGPDNVIIIAAGPLTGTTAPSSSRCEVVTKSPLTGNYGRGDVGGAFGAKLKYAGYDAIVVSGRAAEPSYLWVDDDTVEIRDARELWGKDVWQSRQALRAAHRARPGERRFLESIGTLTIGPAGEHLSLAACVMDGVAHAAALGGLGAVWGSKNLKAVAVRGSRGVDLAQPEEFLQLCRRQWARYEDDPMYASTRKWGTLGWVGGSDSRSAVSDFMLGTRFEEVEEQAFVPLIEKSRACYGCPIHCDHFLHVKEGKYAGTRGEGVEGFVQILGMSFKTASAPFLVKYNNLCNRLGLNVSSVGTAIIWAMELWKQGVISADDTDGVEITEGNEEAILELTRKIAYRDGFGSILADFPVEGARRLGRGSDQYASHTKGQFAWMPGHGIGITLIYTLALNVNTRGYDHLMGGMSILTPDLRAEWGITRELLTRLGEERYGDPAIFRDNKWSYHPQIVQAECDFEHMMVMADMAGTCKFATQYNQPVEGINLPEWSAYLTAATGVSFTEASLRDAARRVITLERSYNAREGVRRLDDYPFFLWWQKKFGEPHPLYAVTDVPFTAAEYDRILDEWYVARGCDLESGIPNGEELARSGLGDVADDLRSRGVLPG